jgi:predicted RND superfamily exporter protein
VSALQHVDRPVTYTTLGLCLGFLAFTSAELRMQAEVGLTRISHRAAIESHNALR